MKKISTIIERILRTIARPALHVGAELMSIGTLGMIAAVAIAIMACAAILAVAWARDMAGIAPDSVQDAVLTIAVCGAAAYVFFRETGRVFRKLRGWTDIVHKRIAMV